MTANDLTVKAADLDEDGYYNSPRGKPILCKTLIIEPGLGSVKFREDVRARRNIKIGQGTNVTVQGSMRVGGDVDADGAISAWSYIKIGGTVFVEGDLTAGGSIDLGGNISSNGSITGREHIVVSGDIYIFGSVTAALDIDAGSIELGGDVEAGGNITVGEYVEIDGDIAAGCGIDIGQWIKVGGGITAGRLHRGREQHRGRGRDPMR